MSGIAVVVRRAGEPADRAALGRVLARLSHRGPDGECTAVAGEAALGHRHFRTTPEEAGEAQPLADRAGRLLIACDGRVDNRNELLPALGVPPEERAALSDAAALLAVYARWGVPGFVRVVGPFAAAIWDAAAHRLVLVRDALGDRTVCYAATADAFVAASEEQAVLAHPGVSGDLDERRLARFFALGGLEGDGTFFAAVREVLPAHAVVVDGDGLRQVRYWAPEAGPLRLRDKREYGEMLADRLREAVAAQLRSTGPVALLLSGGLDSSAIAATASSLAPRRPLKAVSWVFDELPSCDERAWIDPVVRHCCLEPLQFAGDGEWPFRDIGAWRRNPSSPEEDLYRRLVERARTVARSAGCRVLLSGMFGDHLYSGTQGWLWERLVSGAPGRALADLGLALRGGGFAGVRAAVLPRGEPIAVRRLRRALAPQAPWLTRYAAGLLEEAGRWPPSARGGVRPAQHRSVLGLLAAHGVSGETFHAASAGIDARYPFRDRGVVELMLRVPSDQLYRPGLARPILREAMRGMLPEEARMRAGKTSLAALFRRGVGERERKTVEALLRTGRPLWQRFVRPEWVERAGPGRREREIEELVLAHCALFGRWLDNHACGVL
jgi:asparagine synthase (glutamine-hydrolysing)